MTKCICITCGKEFYVHDCYIKRDGKRLYCNAKCYDRSGKNNPRYKPDEGWVNCKGCGIRFKVKPTSLRNGKSKTYCSIKCRNKHTGKIIKKCKECGNEFECYVSKSNKKLFCSSYCSFINRYRDKKQINMSIQRGRGGKRKDLNDMYFRSSWEANYARYLNFLVDNKKIIRWEYEPDTFEFFEVKRGTRFYTPDFKIFNNNGFVEYHEVKGWRDQKTVTRENRMNKYYPDVKIIMIEKQWFRKNGPILSKILLCWEKHY